MTRAIALLLTGTAAVAALSACAPTMTASEPVTASAAPAAAPASTNPLTAPYAGPYGGVPAWDQLNPELFPAAFTEAMDEYRTQAAAVRDNPAPATFDNVHLAMMGAGEKIERVYSYWGVMTSNLSNPRVQELEAEWEPKLSAFFDEISLDDALFQRYKSVYDRRASLGLTAQQMRIVERSYEGYVRNGANLNAEQKAQLTAINGELAGLFTQFGSKLLADEQTTIVVTDEARLAGLPDAFKASLAQAAGRPGAWAIKNTRSSVQPVLQYATDRSLREQVWRAFTMRGDNPGTNNTGDTIERVLALRQQRAQLLGFANHAVYRMQDTMARNPDRAMELMMRVWRPDVARVREEVADMQRIADAEARTSRTPRITIEPWDYRFYAEKVRKERYDLSEEEVKPYLELGNMVNGMFWAAGNG